MNASDILRKAADTIDEKAKERGEISERSIKRTVEMFNAQWDTNLTEQQGWSFMQHLKASRNISGHKDDDLIDKVAYAALEAECVIEDFKEEDSIVLHGKYRHTATGKVSKVTSLDPTWATILRLESNTLQTILVSSLKENFTRIY